MVFIDDILVYSKSSEEYKQFDNGVDNLPLSYLEIK